MSFLLIYTLSFAIYDVLVLLGGYYLSMACDEIVANELTVTGSIGVVTAKFNAEKLNEKIGELLF